MFYSYHYTSLPYGGKKTPENLFSPFTRPQFFVTRKCRQILCNEAFKSWPTSRKASYSVYFTPSSHKGDKTIYLWTELSSYVFNQRRYGYWWKRAYWKKVMFYKHFDSGAAGTENRGKSSKIGSSILYSFVTIDLSQIE